jgi:hypothetical protein
MEPAKYIFMMRLRDFQISRDFHDGLSFPDIGNPVGLSGMEKVCRLKANKKSSKQWNF